MWWLTWTWRWTWRRTGTVIQALVLLISSFSLLISSPSFSSLLLTSSPSFSSLLLMLLLLISSPSFSSLLLISSPSFSSLLLISSPSFSSSSLAAVRLSAANIPTSAMAPVRSCAAAASSCAAAATPTMETVTMRPSFRSMLEFSVCASWVCVLFLIVMIQCCFCFLRCLCNEPSPKTTNNHTKKLFSASFFATRLDYYSENNRKQPRKKLF